MADARRKEGVAFVQQLYDKIETLTLQVDSLTEEKQGLADALGAERSLVDELRAEKSALERRVGDLEAERTEAESSRRLLQSRVEALGADRKTLEEEMTELVEELAEAEEARADLEEMAKAEREEAERAREKVRQLKSQLKSERNSAHAMIKELRGQVRGAESSLAKAVAERDELVQNIEAVLGSYKLLRAAAASGGGTEAATDGADGCRSGGGERRDGDGGQSGGDRESGGEEEGRVVALAGRIRKHAGVAVQGGRAGDYGGGDGSGSANGRGNISVDVQRSAEPLRMSDDEVGFGGGDLAADDDEEGAHDKMRGRLEGRRQGVDSRAYRINIAGNGSGGTRRSAEPLHASENEVSFKGVTANDVEEEDAHGGQQGQAGGGRQGVVDRRADRGDAVGSRAAVAVSDDPRADWDAGEADERGQHADAILVREEDRDNKVPKLIFDASDGRYKWLGE